jgi:hypothetical protein
MDKLTYRQLQKIAKENGIPANLKKDDMILRLTEAMEAKENGNTSEEEVVEESTPEVTVVDVVEEQQQTEVEPEVKEVVEKEALVEVVSDNEEVAEQVIEEEQQNVELEEVVIEEAEVEHQVMEVDQVEEEVDVEEHVDEVEVEETMPMEMDNELNQAYSSYANVLHQLATEKTSDTTLCETEAVVEPVESVVEPVETVVEPVETVVEPVETVIETEAVVETEAVLEDSQEPLSAKQQLVHNFGLLSFRDLQKVAKSLGIAANLKRSIMTEVIIEQQLAAQAEVVVVVHDDNAAVEEVELVEEVCAMHTPAKQEVDMVYSTEKVYDEVSTRDIDLIFDAHEDEDAEYECYEEQEYENENGYYDDMEEDDCSGLGKKLFCTPAKNSKITFSSPTPSKSGTKPYEKFNVTWTYDDFENKDPQQQETPLGSWSEKATESEDPRSRVGGKMKGMSTPKGTKTTFMSPQKSVEKPYYKYNVHWSYDQYAAAVDK